MGRATSGATGQYCVASSSLPSPAQTCDHSRACHSRSRVECGTYDLRVKSPDYEWFTDVTQFAPWCVAVPKCGRRAARWLELVREMRGKGHRSRMVWPLHGRSEERRVGKERRSRGPPTQWRKKHRCTY